MWTRSPAVMFRYNSRDFPTVLLVFHATTLKVRTLVDAAQALLSQWPDDDGEEFVVAVKKCLDAIMGFAPPRVWSACERLTLQTTSRF
jgi:hypothetical protein